LWTRFEAGDNTSSIPLIIGENYESRWDIGSEVVCWWWDCHLLESNVSTTREGTNTTSIFPNIVCTSNLFVGHITKRYSRYNKRNGMPSERDIQY